MQQVDKGALAIALQTKKGSWIPWSRKRYFDRRAFEADLKRIEAFYRDRGFPDARVRSFDVKLNDAQDKVDITLDISEGEPIRVESDRLSRVRRDSARPAAHAAASRCRSSPATRSIASWSSASRERALNALRDEGYPYAEVTLGEEEAGPGSAASSRRRARRAGAFSAKSTSGDLPASTSM